MATVERPKMRLDRRKDKLGTPGGAARVSRIPDGDAGHTVLPPSTGGRLALGILQLIALAGVIGLAVIAGAVLVDDTSVPGWIDGLAIGAGSVLLTLVVLFSGWRLRGLARRD